jgi:hypothetical protein
MCESEQILRHNLGELIDKIKAQWTAYVATATPDDFTGGYIEGQYDVSRQLAAVLAAPEPLTF